MVLILLLFVAEPVLFKAKNLYYSEEKKVVILKDSASIRTGDVKLYADSIVYKRKLKHLLAYGSPLLIIGDDSLRGDSLYYNTETRRGVAFKGKTKAEKGYLTGLKIYKITDKVLHVEEGFFTTCEENPPHYTFYSPKMKIIQNEMAIVSPLILEIKGIPALGAPFWFFPIGKGRKSGFMTPRFGYNKYDGKYIRNLAYYLVINNYMDVTLGVDLLERRGIRTDWDFVYHRYKSFSGSFAFTWAQEFEPEKRRWSLFGNHSQDIPSDIQLKIQTNLVSDRYYIQEYSEEKTEWLQSDLISFLSLTKRWSLATAKLVIDDRRDLIENERQTTLPGFNLTLFAINLNKLRFSGNLEAKRFKESTPSYEKSEYSASSNLSGTSQLKIFRYFQLSPSFKVESRLYEEAFGKRNVLKNTYSISSSFSTVIYGLSKFGIGPISRIRQTIKPIISFHYSPEVIGNSPDVYLSRKTERLSITITNDYEGKLKSGEKLTLLTSTFSTGYNRLEEGPWSPLSFSLQLLPQKKLHTRLQGSYDINRKRLSSIQWITDLSLHLTLRTVEDTADTTGKKVMWSFHIVHSYTWSYNVGETKRISLNISGRPTSKWSFRFGMSYDMESKRIIDQNISLERDLHCWAFSFRWSKFGENWIYDFKIWIKELPDITFKRSLFEIFLPK
jgi:lipopolysaccharide assembly outer membrane protein LptD (OstA)